MRINKFGQVTNKSNDLLLTPQQEEFMKSLLDNGKATSLSLRYGRAIANRIVIPSTIYDTTFSSIEEALNSNGKPLCTIAKTNIISIRECK